MNSQSKAPSEPAAVHWSDPARHAAFNHWLLALRTKHGLDPAGVRPASADASFRRYLRIDAAAGTRIIMDAPPAHEDGHPFVNVARLLRGAGLSAPDVIEWDEAEGFMLLSDLGSTTYLSQLNAYTAPRLYDDALDALVTLQGIPARTQVPPYDRHLLERELRLFPDWYVSRHLQTVLSGDEHAELERVFELILANNLAQPAVLVHRDYHSRNLMVLDQGNPGILDFQDAVFGPITYDVVSLLRDAYIEWDEDVQIDYAARYWQKARRAGLPVAADFGAFWRDLEWMGLQRHLKVLGIFARLYHRDGKDGYLKDLPLVARYTRKVAQRYQGLGPLAHLLDRLEGRSLQVGYTF